jgi:hypothetical protein
VYTEETRKKMSEKAKHRVRPLEMNKKISESLKAFHAKIKSNNGKHC